MWEIIVLAVLFVATAGISVYMVTKTKKQEIIVRQPDFESLIVRVAEVVATKIAEEFIAKLGQVGYYGSRQSPDTAELAGQISIDESVIPTRVDLDISETNLEGMLVEETTEDEGLTESKSKLSQILKKKGR